MASCPGPTDTSLWPWLQFCKTTLKGFLLNLSLRCLCFSTAQNCYFLEVFSGLARKAGVFRLAADVMQCRPCSHKPLTVPCGAGAFVLPTSQGSGRRRLCACGWWDGGLSWGLRPHGPASTLRWQDKWELPWWRDVGSRLGVCPSLPGGLDCSPERPPRGPGLSRSWSESARCEHHSDLPVLSPAVPSGDTRDGGEESGSMCTRGLRAGWWLDAR